MLTTAEQQGAEHFFGEPMLDIADWMRVDASGKGGDQPVLSARKLYQMRSCTPPACCGCSPSSSACRKPATSINQKLVFFFDEAHLLFNDAAGAAG
ncbi:DUF853 domain-containing protein [Klebsiella pneumoniae]|nr:DUF853 domain-containing protein [Klebsiella pneumoniae]